MMMALTGTVIFIGCPLVFRMLTPVQEVQALAVQIIRIGLLAEPLYGVSMEYGVMSMPALVVNENVVSMGKVLKAADVEKLLHKLGF